MNGKSRILADIIFLLSLLSLLLLWVWSPGTCSASGTYVITEQELTQLEVNLTRLEQISQTQQAELTRLRQALATSQQELTLLRNQLNTSSKQLTAAQKLLSNANQLLAGYAEEERRTRLRIKAQRNAWLTVAILTGIALAIK